MRCWLTHRGRSGSWSRAGSRCAFRYSKDGQADGFPVRIAALLVLAVLWGIATGKDCYTDPVHVSYEVPTHALISNRVQA